MAFPLQTLFTGMDEYANIELLEDSQLFEITLERLEELYTTDIHLAT